MNPKDYPSLHSLLYGDDAYYADKNQFYKALIKNTITYEKAKELFDPEPEHTCGCGYPNTAPPCWHCTDCPDCNACEHCGDPHAGYEDQCPKLIDPIGWAQAKGIQ